MQSYRTVDGIYVQHQILMELFLILCTWMLCQVCQLHDLAIYMCPGFASILPSVSIILVFCLVLILPVSN